MFSTTNQPPPDLEPTVERAERLLSTLAAGDRTVADIAALSDLSRDACHAVQRSFRQLPVDPRRFLVRRMVEVAEHNLEMNFTRILRLAVTDPDAEVRTLAINGLWEDESPQLLDQLLAHLTQESESSVLEAIARALGRVSYNAAVDKLDVQHAAQVRSTLITLFRSDADLSVRCRSLEAVAYFNDDEAVDEVIAEGYGSRYLDMQASALTAMGRNLGTRWFATVLAELTSEEPELRAEAARASGEYADERAVDSLTALLEDEDEEVQVNAASALGQIGSREAIDALRIASRSNMPHLKSAAERALAEALDVDEPDPFDFIP